MENDRMIVIQDFPLELLHLILFYYGENFRDVILFGLVCKAWKEVSDCSFFWQQLPSFEFRLPAFFQRVNLRYYEILESQISDSFRYRIDVDVVIVFRYNNSFNEPSIHLRDRSSSLSENRFIRNKLMSFLINYRKSYESYHHWMWFYRKCFYWRNKLFPYLYCIIPGFILLWAGVIAAIVIAVFYQGSVWKVASLTLFLMLFGSFPLFVGSVIIAFGNRWEEYQYYDDFRRDLTKTCFEITCCLMILIGILTFLTIFILCFQFPSNFN